MHLIHINSLYENEQEQLFLFCKPVNLDNIEHVYCRISKKCKIESESGLPSTPEVMFFEIVFVGVSGKQYIWSLLSREACKEIMARLMDRSTEMKVDPFNEKGESDGM